MTRVEQTDCLTGGRREIKETKHSQMLDRLFIEAYPRDEYQRKSIEDSLSCQFETSPHLVQYDLQVSFLGSLFEIPYSLNVFTKWNNLLNDLIKPYSELLLVD